MSSAVNVSTPTRVGDVNTASFVYPTLVFMGAPVWRGRFPSCVFVSQDLVVRYQTAIKDPNFQPPKLFAVITLKRGLSIEKSVLKMVERLTM